MGSPRTRINPRQLTTKFGDTVEVIFAASPENSTARVHEWDARFWEFRGDVGPVFYGLMRGGAPERPAVAGETVQRGPLSRRVGPRFVKSPLRSAS